MEVKSVFALLCAVIPMDITAQSPYCDICPEHTMCIYQNASSSCGKYFAGGVSDDDQAAILELHNSLRRKVAQGNEPRGSNGPQPQAANMRKMVWNAELASVAQRWANQCQFGHDDCRDVSSFPAGQNVAQTSSTRFESTSKANWKEPALMWYDEVALFNNDNIYPFQFTSDIGHYTQMLWAESSAVGCGYVYYQQQGSSFYDSYYVCNYGPAGNVIKDAMYEEGEPCSHCPDSTQCEDGLCA